MNPHTFDILEYEKIIQLLASYASSGLGAYRAQQIHPLTDIQRIERLIAETTELKSLLSPNLTMPIGGLHDLFPLFNKLEQDEGILLTEEIMLFRETFRAFRNIKGFLEDSDASYLHLHRWAHSIRIYPDIEGKIDRTFGESGAMKNSASPELKSIRTTSNLQAADRDSW